MRRFLLGTLLLAACSGQLDDGPSTEDAVPPRLPPRVWRLTNAQIDAEVTRLFGDGAPPIELPVPASERGITNIAAAAGIDEGSVSALLDGTRAITDWVVTGAAERTRCGAAWGSDACLEGMLAWLPEAAYRRPVSDAERTELSALYFDLRAAGYDFDEAMRGVVRAVLLSADFLYRTELGTPATPTGDVVVLTQHEIATLIAFVVTDAAPDDELLAAAAAGRLTSPDEREAHVRRLLPRSGAVWQRFFWEWLAMETLRSQAVEVGLSDTLRVQMEEEYAAFMNDVVVENDGTLEDVFNATHSFVGPELAAHYGIAHPGTGTARVELDPTQRSGLLGLGAWLVAHGKRGRDNVVRRGMGLFREGMCNNVRPPDGVDVNAELARLAGPDATVREVVDVRGSVGSCAGCHRTADPMGLVFEHYRSDGAWQDAYPDGMPIDTEILFDGESITRAPDLTAVLTSDPRFRNCFVRRFAHFAVGRDLGRPSQLLWLSQSFGEFDDSGDQLDELVIAFVRHPAFIEREL